MVYQNAPAGGWCAHFQAPSPAGLQRRYPAVAPPTPKSPAVPLPQSKMSPRMFRTHVYEISRLVQLAQVTPCATSYTRNTVRPHPLSVRAHHTGHWALVTRHLPSRIGPEDTTGDARAPGAVRSSRRHGVRQTIEAYWRSAWGVSQTSV
jgi:hypothetical protein